MSGKLSLPTFFNLKYECNRKYHQVLALRYWKKWQIRLRTILNFLCGVFACPEFFRCDAVFFFENLIKMGFIRKV